MVRPEIRDFCGPKLVALSLISLITLTTLRSVLGQENHPPPKADTRRLAEVREILGKVPLIDGHNDLPWQYRKRRNDFSAINLETDTRALGLVTDISRLRTGGLGGQFWSVYVPAELHGPAAVKAVLEQIDVVHQMVARYPA